MTNIIQNQQPIALALNHMYELSKFNIDGIEHLHQNMCINIIICAVNLACSETEFCITPEQVLDRTLMFGSHSIPSMEFNNYVIERLIEYMEPNTNELIQSIILIDHLLARYGSHDLALTWRTVHRLFALALMITIKFTNDLCYTNYSYAKIFGISNIECNELEIFFLEGINFSVWIQPYEIEFYSQYITHMTEYHSGKVLCSHNN